jgi:hypothetical protein
MIDPVSLTPSDIGTEATVIREFTPEELGEESYTQYFYHHENSELPIRDVTNTKEKGPKTEPCIESHRVHERDRAERAFPISRRSAAPPRLVR